MSDIGKIEYRVRKTERYVVTRYHESIDGPGAGVETKGEYENGGVAFEVAYALCRAEHERLGFPPGDMRIIYPEPLFQGDGLVHHESGIAPIAQMSK